MDMLREKLITNAAVKKGYLIEDVEKKKKRKIDLKSNKKVTC